MADRCCKCQNTGVCKSCLCVREGRHCTDCYPSRLGRCCNLPLDPLPQQLPSHVACTPSFVSCSPSVSPSPSSSSPSVNHSFMNSSPLYPSTESGDSEGHYLDDGEVDSMLHSAYGATLASSTIPDNEWYSRWMSITQLSGNHYFLPKGQCGRRYVNLLSAEVDFLSGGVILLNVSLCSAL